jgi:hypothetical protein
MSALHKVRFYISDTDASAFLLHDEEILNGPLSTFPNSVYRAAAEAALMCAAKLGKEPNRTAIGMSDDSKSPADFYLGLADQLLEKGARNGLTVFAGGRTVSGKEDLALDTDKIQPSFSIGQDDNPQISESTRHYHEE